MKLIVEEVLTGVIVTRDLMTVQPPEVIRTLSGPSSIKFQVMPEDAEGVDFKAYKYLIHAETKKTDGTRWIIATGIVQPVEIDPESGMITIEAQGFSNYLDKIPWLDNWNPIAVDPFEVIHRIWNHVQSYPQGNLGVTVQPANSGTMLLPGFYYDGSEFVLDFFAYFVRAEDYRDCLEEVVSLCRDIPIDFFEQSTWNSNRTAINKVIQLEYPRGGSQLTAVMFRERENLLSSTPAQEEEIDWVSDIIVRSWFPGKMRSSTFSNADTSRLRKVIKEEDALINSRERAAVWAKRKLKRRQIPPSFTTLNLDMHHPNAPFGTYDVGDDIKVMATHPIYGRISAFHRVMSMQVDDVNENVTLVVKHVDGFNYDPVSFEGW